MKVTLCTRALFGFEISHGLIMELMELAKRHYDGECKMTLNRVGQPIYPGSTIIARQNGLLTMWNDRFENDADRNDTENVFASWDDLDLISKVCEFPPNNGEFEDWTRSRAFGRSISKMFDVARPKIEREWKVSFDV